MRSSTPPLHGDGDGVAVASAVGTGVDAACGAAVVAAGTLLGCGDPAGVAVGSGITSGTTTVGLVEGVGEGPGDGLGLDVGLRTGVGLGPGLGLGLAVRVGLGEGPDSGAEAVPGVSGDAGAAAGKKSGTGVPGAPLARKLQAACISATVSGAEDWNRSHRLKTCVTNRIVTDVETLPLHAGGRDDVDADSGIEGAIAVVVCVAPLESIWACRVSILSIAAAALECPKRDCALRSP